jgi:hypothetical protein
MSNRDSLSLSLFPRSHLRRRGGAPGASARVVFSSVAVVASVLLTALSGCGAADAGGEGQELTVVGTMGAIEFVATPLAPLAEGPNAFRVGLFEHDSRARLEGAALRIHVMMPSMGHEATVEPGVDEVSPGVYEITDVVFTMPGTWEVRYRVKRSTLHDEAAFRYEVR